MKPNLHHPLGKALLLFLISFTLQHQSFSQAFIFGNKIKYEAGINFGPSFFLGDLGGHAGKGTTFIKDLNLNFTNVMKGAYITVYPSKWIGFRLSAGVTHLEGDDAVIKDNGGDELARKQRNLDFKTDIWEINGAFEFFPTMFFNQNSDDEPRLRPYGVLGAGAFHFNPKGSLTDINGNKRWYALQPLRTEGQGMTEYPERKPYKLTQLNIPMGAGIKYYFSDRVNASLEFLYRKTFTDYIDDVSSTYIDPKDFNKYLSAQDAAIATAISDKVISGIVSPVPGGRYLAGEQRGNINNKDTYFTFSAKVGFRLGTIYESSFARKSAMQTRCPSVY
jgi:hypothetical protein